ncbi:MAG TPA: hypothetical protein VFW78_14215 [Bacteroidia bacterium]|nr:hypothetical protein [Bacteroidia bacterium]
MKIFFYRSALPTLIICFCSFIYQTGSAQTSNLGDEQINVVKPYEPTLSDAFKISDVPGRDTAVAYTPDLTYTVQPVRYETVYTITPIKPVKIKDETIKDLYRGFVKGGYGTKNTPYIEVFYNALRSKDFDAGVHLSHISSSGKIKDYGYPGMSETGIDLFGKKFFDQTLLEGRIGYNRLVYHYYGYNDPPDIFSKSETKHSFDDLQGDFSFKSINKSSESFRYMGGVAFHNISDNNDNNESRILLKGSGGKAIADGNLDVGVELDFMKYKPSGLSDENLNIYRMMPRYKGSMDKVDFEAGFNAVVESNDKTKSHLYPYANIILNMVPDAFSIFANLGGNLERNSFRDLSLENPFTASYLELRNTNVKLDISGGVKIRLERELFLIGSARFTDAKHQAYFLNVPAQNTLVVYDVIYDNTTTLNLHGEVKYEQDENTGVSGVFDYYSYNTHDLDKPLFKPDYKISFSAFHNLGEKIFLSTQLTYVASRYAMGYSTSDFITMKGYFDGNIMVDYRYSKVLSLFLNLNNFTGSKYARWYNYPSYRFAAMAGISWSF